MSSSPPPRLSLRELTCAVARWPQLHLAAGECAALRGPSGAGKSRLLRAVADLDPNTGEVAVDGESRAALSGHQWRRRVAYLPAESAWWGVNVGDHFAAREPSVLTALGFDDDVFEWSVSRLSSGERSRLALARALVLAPRVLLLDEPTANLDTTSAAAVEAVVARQRAAGVAVVWVTHDPAQIERLGARCYTIHHGVAEAR